MILPQAVSKATGLQQTLRALRLSRHNTVGLGDAENDHELLRACEIGIAVAWGSAALRRSADEVLGGEGPDAVAGWLRSLAAGPRILKPSRRRRLVLGWDADGAVVALGMRGRNVLITGDPKTGKSWVAGLLCEQLVMEGYGVCVLDPEGDYASLEALPDVVLLGRDDPPPTMNELARTLRHADTSVVVDLARMPAKDKRDYVVRALQTLTALRRQTGLPHRIVVDEAHYFLDDPEASGILDGELAGYILVTYRPSGLQPSVLAATECAIVTRHTDPREVATLRGAWPGMKPHSDWTDALSALEIQQAALLPVADDAHGALRKFRLAPRFTRHVRHQHKYLDIPVAMERGFVFVADDGEQGPVARTLHELVAVLGRGVSIRGHAERGDFSRWFEDVFGDAELAERVRALEARHRLGTLPDLCGALSHAVRERYDGTRTFV